MYDVNEEYPDSLWVNPVYSRHMTTAKLGLCYVESSHHASLAVCLGAMQNVPATAMRGRERLNQPQYRQSAPVDAWAEPWQDAVHRPDEMARFRLAEHPAIVAGLRRFAAHIEEDP